jgi:hypothetical protein
VSISERVVSIAVWTIRREDETGGLRPTHGTDRGGWMKKLGEELAESSNE